MSSQPHFSNLPDQVAGSFDEMLGPVFFEPYAMEMATRLPNRRGLRILEVAAGTGRVTKHLLDRLPPDGNLVATDLHEDMLAVAQKNIQGPRIQWRIADALDLPFDNSSFDVVLCQFGAMFYRDKLQGHREALRVLKPAGTYLVSTWAPQSVNLWGRHVHFTLAELFPHDPPGFMAKPFSYGNPEAITSDLDQAGFSNAKCDQVIQDLEIKDPRSIAMGFLLGSQLATSVLERGGDLEEVAAKIAEAYKREGGQPYRSSMTALFASATKP